MIEGIKTTENDLNEALDSGDNEIMKNEIGNYSKKVVALARVVDEGTVIQTFLYKTIPEKTMTLLKKYKQKKLELDTEFKNLDFSGAFNDIRTKYASAKTLFKNLSIDKASYKIKEILKSLKLLEEMINIEIYSRNLFLKNFENVVSEIKVSLKAFISLKTRVRKIDKSLISIELREAYNESSEASKSIDKDAILFSEVVSDNDISFSSKLSRMKRLLNQNLLFIKGINELEEILWSLNSKNLLIENKFLRTVEAFNSLISKIKKSRIFLSNEQRKIKSNLQTDIASLSSLVKQKTISKEDEKKLDDLSFKISEFYVVVSGNVQMALIAQNLIKKLSPRRSSDQSLDIALSTSEKEYLSGRYDAALNVIIVWMEQEA